MKTDTIPLVQVKVTSASFLPNYSKPVWVIAIRVAGVFMPKIGDYSFDAFRATKTRLGWVL